jgi:Flp pilus assembly protein TadD
MMPSTSTFDRQARQSFTGGSVGIMALLTVTLCGCVSSPVDTHAVHRLSPLELDDRSLSVAEAPDRVSQPNLLALDQSMREFVALYTAEVNSKRAKLMSLHQAVRGAGTLGVRYEPFAEGTAQDVFHGRYANCLSYANLFVALSREAGLEASYQWQEVRPQWSRVSDQVQIGLHVNVSVKLHGGRSFTVDIDPLPSRDIAGSQQMTDVDALALYYNNIAMDALGREDLETAWYNVVRALQLSPNMSHLWVNLGAVYRNVGQHREAERSYLRALDLDFTEYSAMANLAVLYEIEGRVEERKHWLDKVRYHRESNPYYHAWQGDEAASGGEFEVALRHYNQAVALLPRDSQLLYARGLILYRLNDFDDAAVNIQEAIELATLVSDKAFYQLQLEEVRRAQLVGS